MEFRWAFSWLFEADVLAFSIDAAQNKGMDIQGVVQNGVVVLPPDVTLADGTVVVLHCSQDQVPVEPRPRKRAQFPLVHSKNPGTLHLTNDMIAEFLNDTEISR